MFPEELVRCHLYHIERSLFTSDQDFLQQLSLAYHNHDIRSLEDMVDGIGTVKYYMFCIADYTGVQEVIPYKMTGVWNFNSRYTSIVLPASDPVLLAFEKYKRSLQ